MGLFDGLFGGKQKPNFGGLYPDPPQYSLAPGSLDRYQGQIQSLTDLFGNRANGTDQFDYLKYVYGPQMNYLNQQYGINTNPGDVYSQQSGILPQTLASLNRRGLADAGTSGVIESQLRSNLAGQQANLFGQAKVGQKNDINDALAQLAQLFPQQFQTAQIQPNVDYSNAMSRFNQDFNRNSAQQSYEASKPGNPLFSLGGGVLGTLFGGPVGGAIGSQIGGAFSGGGYNQTGGNSGSNLFGNIMNNNALSNLWGGGRGGSSGSQGTPGFSSGSWPFFT